MPDLNFWNIVFIIWLIKGGNYFNHSQHTAAHMTCLDFWVLSVFWNYAYLFVSKHKKMSAHTNKHLFCLYLLVAATVIKIRNENEKRYRLRQWQHTSYCTQVYAWYLALVDKHVMWAIFSQNMDNYLLLCK